MKRCLIICQNPALAANLPVWLTVKGIVSQDQIGVMAVEKAFESENVSSHFLAIADWLEDEVAKGCNFQGIPEVVVLTDLAGYGPVTWSDLNPVARHDWSAVLGMLSLAFPECHFVLVSGEIDSRPQVILVTQEGTAKSYDLRLGCNPEQLEQVLNFTKTRYSSLFDGAGFRNAVRIAMATDEIDVPYMPVRSAVSAAVDDEASYAYFNAYVAYRFGFRSFSVCTVAQSRALFKHTESISGALTPPVLTFEDVCLSCPDGQRDEHYSDLGGDSEGSRKMSLPLLDRVNYRIFVTTQHQQVGHTGKNAQNQFYIRSGLCVLNGTAPNRYGILLLKPFSGMFDLWRRSGLDHKLCWWDYIGKRFRRGVGEGYIWPPRQQNELDGDTGHSAPGRLLMVATHLIRRCEKLLPSACSVPEAVRCAVLATDALELLGDRTPTTAMDALWLKHLAEVTAECRFSGVEYRIEMHARLKEIQRDATHIGQWFDHRQQKSAAMNAEMTTLVDIVKILRQHGQFDEIQICQNRIRYLHNRLWVREYRLGFVFLPFLAYFELVLSSFLVFSCAIVLWGIVFVVLFYLARSAPPLGFSALPASWTIAIKDALERFIAMKEFGAGKSVWWCMTATLASVMSVTHIGLFISHLQLILKRKE